MECLTLNEHLIFSSNITASFNGAESFEAMLLLSIEALYFFEKKNNQLKEGPDILESHLLFKFKHEEICLKNILSNDDSIEYYILKKFDDFFPEFFLKFSNQPKGKDYVKILILFEGWKFALNSIKRLLYNNKNEINSEDYDNENNSFFNNEISENSDDENNNKTSNNSTEIREEITELNFDKHYLFEIIEKFISNDFTLIIDYIFLKLEKKCKGFVKLFFNCICYFQKIQIKLLFDDEISKTFQDFIPNDDMKFCLRHLNLSSANLKDNYAESILIPLINNSPHLENLNISNNNLTNSFLNIMIEEVKPNIFLKTFNISYNQLTSENLSKIIYQISKLFLAINLFDLRGNKIDNNFLNYFEPKNYEELHSKIQDLINSSNSSKEIITFDLRDNEIELEKTSLRFHLKKKKELSTHLEIKNIFNEEFEIKFSGFDFMRFIFDVYFFKKNYKFNGASKSTFKLNINVKYYQLRLQNSNNNKLVRKNVNNRNFKFITYIKDNNNDSEEEEEEENEDTVITTSRKPKVKFQKFNKKKNHEIKNEINEIPEEESVLSDKNKKNDKNNDNIKSDPKNLNKNFEDSIIVEDDYEEEELDEEKKEEEKKKEISKQRKTPLPSKKSRFSIYGKKRTKQQELELYRKLFQYFFLLDYYFDPILNSFSTYNSNYIKRGNDYMNIKNQDERYAQLRMSINPKEKNVNNENKRINQKENTIEIPEEEARIMYYEYKNHLNYIQTQICRDKIIKKITKNQTPQDILEEIYKNIINTQSLFPKNIRFNPNAYIDHLSYIYLFLSRPHDYKIKIPFTTLNKLISRIKIESVLCYREKSHNSLSALSKITKGLNLSLQEQINKKYNQLCQKAQLIIKGLTKILNFEGKEKYSHIRSFIFESGNFLDIFIKKADEINLECDLVNIAKYVQYWRDNYLRNEIHNFIIDISKKEESPLSCDMNEEFSPANNKFKNWNITKMNLPKEIKYKEFSLHPSNLDYLKLSECDYNDLKNDLEEITRLIKVDQTYGRRNVYDRLNFLFCNTSKIRKNKTNYYKLHKGNIYLKIMRVLFRYFNNIDFNDYLRRIENKNYEIKSIPSFYIFNSSTLQNKIFTNHNIKFIDENSINKYDIEESLENVAIEEFNLRMIEFKDIDYTDLSEVQKKNKSNIRLLEYSEDYTFPETLLNIDDSSFSNDQKRNFKNIAKNIISKYHDKLKNLNEITKPKFVIILRHFISYFLFLKKNFSKEKKFWEFINLECFYQLYRFANRDNFSYKKEKNEYDYPFIILYLMCHYFEFSESMIRRIKGFVYYLFSNMSHRKHCKGIIKALNNPYRYDWVMSTYEIYKKINCENIVIEIFYPSNNNNLKEEFEINETTTAGKLFEIIKEKSFVLKDSVEKEQYWIYYVSNDNPISFQFINYEELILKLISIQEETESKDFFDNFSLSNDVKTYKSVVNSEKKSLMNEIKEIQDLNFSNEKKTFQNMHFEIRRRIFSPSLFKGDISNINFYEQELLYNQIKSIFYHSNIVDYTWYEIGEELAIICYFEKIADDKRQEVIKSKLEMEKELIKNNSNALLSQNIDMEEIEKLDFPKLKYNFNIQNAMGRDSNFSESNISNNNKDEESKKLMEEINSFYPKNFGEKEGSLKISYENIKKSIHKLKDPKKEFFEIIKLKPILLSNIYEVNVRQCNDTFPDKLIISISLEKIEFLFRTNFKQFFEFKYDEIVKILIGDNYFLLLQVNVKKDDLDERSEIIIELETVNNRFILEDILSYSQIYLASNTKSEYVEIDDNNLINLKNYNLIYNRNLPFKKIIYKSSENINNKDFEKMRNSLHNNIEYIRYKQIKNEEIKKKEEEKQKKEKEAKEAHKKGTLDVKTMVNIPRFNNFDDDSKSDESDDSEVHVQKLNLNSKSLNVKENNIMEKLINKNEIIEEKKEDIKEEKKEEINEEKKEEKIEEKKEEKILNKEEQELIHKQEIHNEKLKNAELALTKALEDFSFDDTEEENNISEDDSDDDDDDEDDDF